MSQIDILKNAMREVVQQELKQFREALLPEIGKMIKANVQRVNESRPISQPIRQQANHNPYITPEPVAPAIDFGSLANEFFSVNGTSLNDY